ncbi:MAG: hypothetical protein JEZ01_20990 [Labilibaculum sp.]|nr:hypothetical protein [Labilibaculum sp.]MBI9060256.1 hypothetical protein [Labilibaculum sp.]
MKGLEEGYKFFTENAAGYTGAIIGEDYISTVISEIEKLDSDINNFKGFRTGASQLKGDVAEFWHSGTHNIDAAVKGMEARTRVDRSHDFASPDIKSNAGEEFGLKYFSGGGLSAKAQAKSYFERFNEYKTSSNNNIIFEEFLRERKISSDEVFSQDPIYNGQIRVIPSDQMMEAISWLERRIAKEGTIRPEQVKRYEETLNLLRDSVKTESGAESISLTKGEAEKLAQLSKQGEFDPIEYGLTTEELINYKNIMQQSIQAGVTAAMISVVLSVAPKVYVAIEYLIQNGEINEEQLREMGLTTLSSFSEGFIRGTVSAAITSSFKSGILGDALKTIDPSVVGAATVIFMNVMKNSYEVACGRMSNSEMINMMIKDMYISTFALVTGGIVQSFIEIPIIGYMLGSFVGSMIGGITYEFGYNKLISFCVDTGFTVFGLVEQDYELPDEVVKQLGLDTYELDTFTYDSFDQDQFEFDSFEYNQFVPDSIDFVFLRRGVIGFNRIGYL